MDAHETEAIVDANATIHVSELPFATGERVRVVVVPQERHPRHTPDEIFRSARLRRTLRGTPVEYDRPDEPVGVEDWEAIKEDNDANGDA